MQTGGVRKSSVPEKRSWSKRVLTRNSILQDPYADKANKVGNKLV